MFLIVLNDKKKFIIFLKLKGSDRVQLHLENKNFNEIKNFVQGRYVAASEAAWRIFKFPIQQHSPIVYRLAIHLKQEHSITFNPDDLNVIINQIKDDDQEITDEIDILLNRTIQSDLNDSNNTLSNEQQKILALLKRNSQTTLMAWFKLNQMDIRRHGVRQRHALAVGVGMGRNNLHVL